MRVHTRSRRMLPRPPGLGLAAASTALTACGGGDDSGGTRPGR